MLREVWQQLSSGLRREELSKELPVPLVDTLGCTLEPDVLKEALSRCNDRTACVPRTRTSTGSSSEPERLTRPHACASASLNSTEMKNPVGLYISGSEPTKNPCSTLIPRNRVSCHIPCRSLVYSSS